MEEFRSGSGSFTMGPGERTTSFLNNLDILNRDCAKAEEAIQSLQRDIADYRAEKDANDAGWLVAEEEWLAELQALKEACGPLTDEERDRVPADQQYWTSSREWRDIVYGGCYLDSVDGGDGDAVSSGGRKSRACISVEAILEQRHFHKKLYYKVKWAGVDVVSWEDADELKIIGALSAVANQIPQRRTARRLRPAVYIPKRGAATSSASGFSSRGGSYPGEWLCEVEHSIWIPYDNSLQSTIEKAYESNLSKVAFTINGASFTIIFDRDRMYQQGANGGPKRAVKRIEKLPDHVLRQRIHTMTLQELREYIATIVDFTPAHYDALARLHEEDKVVTHLTQREIVSLPSMAFSELKNGALNGATHTGLSTECPICLADYVDADALVCMPSCGHTFHRQCAADYFSRFSKLCPYCKESVI